MKVKVLLIGAAMAAMAAGSARVDRLPNVLILGDSISLGYTPSPSAISTARRTAAISMRRAMTS